MTTTPATTSDASTRHEPLRATATATGERRRHFLDALEEVVARHPSRTAIEDEKGALSYAELWERAGAVAASLLSRCPNANDGSGGGGATAVSKPVVAVILPRGRDAIIALVGIWRADAIYLPIDPSTPEDRRAFILRDACATTVIDEAFSSHPLLICARAPLASTGTIAAKRCLHDPAYIIYTSGSTGTPKGVVVSHRGLVSVLEQQIDALGLAPGKRCLLVLSTSFDASLSDIGTCLLSGSTLVLDADPDLARDPSKLALSLERHRITHVDLPPALLPRIDPSTQLPKGSSLEAIVVGGEVCQAESLRAWARRVRVLLAYGPTEATICTSMMIVDAASWSRPLIGFPLTNVVYSRCEETGELLIASDDHLALGYVGAGRGDLDDRGRFMVRDGVRWFRTGDRVCVHAFEFLGRIDRQIKVHGVLVAPEEIEARLETCPGVARAAVVWRRLSTLKHGLEVEVEDQGLVAFVETRSCGGAPPITPTDLRKHVLASLPRAFCPRRFEIDTVLLPETNSGKIDLTALGERPLSEANDEEHEPPHGVTETILAACFEEVLGLPQGVVHRNDDFFALGGDSFFALELVVCASSRGVMIPSNAIYEEPILASLAASVKENATSREEMSAEELRNLVTIEMEARGVGEALARSLASQAFRKGLQGSPHVTSRKRRATAVRDEGTDGGRDILLTGATGFLGSRVLAHLIHRQRNPSNAGTPPQVIHCLVRGSNEADARRRLIAAAVATNQIDKDALASANVRVVCGDIEQPRFGLSREKLEELESACSDVVHLAARVDMVRPFDALRPSNLDGTLEMLRFARENRIKRMHYASTLSVFVATDRHEGVLREDDDLRSTRAVFGGYAQTKWAAEIAVRRAFGSGDILGTSIHRLGLLTSNITPFSAPKGCQLMMFLEGLIAIGCIPDMDLDALALDVTPVDYAARALVALSSSAQSSQKKESRCETFHIANTASLTLGQIARALDDRGIRLPRVPSEELVRRGGTAPLSPTKSAVLLSLTRRLDEHADGGSRVAGRCRSTDLFLATNASFDTARTARALANEGIVCPPPQEILNAHLDRIPALGGAQGMSDA